MKTDHPIQKVEVLVSSKYQNKKQQEIISTECPKRMKESFNFFKSHNFYYFKPAYKDGIGQVDLCFTKFLHNDYLLVFRGKKPTNDGNHFLWYVGFEKGRRPSKKNKQREYLSKPLVTARERYTFNPLESLAIAAFEEMITKNYNKYLLDEYRVDNPSAKIIANGTIGDVYNILKTRKTN